MYMNFKSPVLSLLLHIDSRHNCLCEHIAARTLLILRIELNKNINSNETKSENLSSALVCFRVLDEPPPIAVFNFTGKSVTGNLKIFFIFVESSEHVRFYVCVEEKLQFQETN